MGPGNAAVAQASPGIPILANTAKSTTPRGLAIAKRMKASSKRTALDAGKLSNEINDNRTSFEGI